MKISITLSLIIICLAISNTASFKSCSQQIDDTFRKLTFSETNSLCNRISTFSQDIYFRLIDDVPHQGPATNKLYDDDSNDYFNKKCYGRCSISIALIVYFNAKKVRMVVGSEIDKAINRSDQQNIINSMSNYLKYNDFSKAFQVSLDEISDKLFNKSSSLSTTWIIVLIVIGISMAIIFIVVIYRCCCKTQTETTIVYDNTNDEKIHLHMEKLLDIVKYKVKTSVPPITQIEQCPLCMHYLNPNWERDEFSGVSNSNIFLSKFTCQHLYHSSCLTNKGINGCIMCQLYETQINVFPEIRYYNIVSEENIFNVIKRFDMIYPKRQLQSYNKTYSNDMIVVKEVYPYYTPSTFVWVDVGPHYYGGYGGGYEHNTYNTYNNYNPPTNNVPMNDYNVVTGADYGGNDYGGYNYTTGADYGGNDNYTTGADYGGGNDYCGSNTVGGDY